MKFEKSYCHETGESSLKFYFETDDPIFETDEYKKFIEVATELYEKAFKMASEISCINETPEEKKDRLLNPKRVIKDVKTSPVKTKEPKVQDLTKENAVGKPYKPN